MTDLKTDVHTGVGCTLLDCDSYLPQEFFEKLEGLKREAEEEGFTNCVLKFNSTAEPYESYTDHPEVWVYGDRPFTEEELQKQESEKEIYALAEAKGLTPFEARQLKNLMDKGVI